MAGIAILLAPTLDVPQLLCKLACAELSRQSSESGRFLAKA
jgi:hypothetical protein